MEEKFIKIPEWSLQLLKVEGYFERYHFHCKKLNDQKKEWSYAEAWRLTENELRKYFRIKRYESYGSFRAAKSQDYTRKKTRKEEVLIFFV